MTFHMIEKNSFYIIEILVSSQEWNEPDFPSDLASSFRVLIREMPDK